MRQKERAVKRSSARRARTRRWNIHISLESKALRIHTRTIRSLMSEILKHVDTEIAPQEVCEIHVMFVNDARMREMNFEFRKKDKATDVLSFPQFTPAEVRGKKPVREVGSSYLGDLVISTETTIKQAKRFNVTKRAELIRLLTHGVLHLCGYDHEKVPAKEANRMRRRERAIRAQIGDIR